MERERDKFELLPYASCGSSLRTAAAGHAPMQQEPGRHLPGAHEVQLAADDEIAPSDPYFPAAHCDPEQDDRPVLAWYLPAALPHHHHTP